MRIEKRTLVKYLVMNCLTLGIYGFIVAKDMDREINAICKDDKQEPGMSYVMAWLFSKVFGLGTLYYDYWWYQQANRLKMNAGRYGLKVKESGTDIFLFRTAVNIPLIAVTVIEIFLAMLIPLLVGLLFALLLPLLGAIIWGMAGLLLLLFGNELSAGANIANYYMMKNLNRYADAARAGTPNAFDPLDYEYYPCVAVNYPAMVGGVAPVVPVNNVPQQPVVKEESNTSLLSEEVKVAPAAPKVGVLVGEKGTCAGYKFDLVPGEEIIIGKDAKEASVVIDPAYKEVSRKHVGVTYDIGRDLYRVVDYSSNGTWANGVKMTNGKVMYLPHGTEIELANAKNKFLLG